MGKTPEEKVRDAARKKQIKVKNKWIRFVAREKKRAEKQKKKEQKIVDQSRKIAAKQKEQLANINKKKK
jgi:hypothetical protein